MFADTFHDSLTDAIAEVQRRRKDAEAEQLITRIVESPYGGFRVRSIPAEFIIDQMADFGIVTAPVASWSKLVA